MDVAKREGLAKACRKEKDSRVILRMLAVHMARVRKMNVSETAANLMRSDRWVHTWLERFDAGDLDGLRDLPRSGRSPKIPRETMARIIEQAVQPQCTPRELQKIIREDAGTKLYITNVRKAMRRHGLTSKVPQKVHINKAGKEAVRGWQYRFDKRVSRLEGDGFTMVDEAFFIHDVISGRKYWSPRGERIVVPYTGSHNRIVVYGAIARDGRQFFRTHKQFDAPTFVGYLKEMQRHFGKVAVVTDRAPRIAQNSSRSCYGRTKTSGSFTSRRDPRTSARSRNAGAKENKSCSSRNTIGRLLTCAMPSSRIIGPWDSSWTHSNLPTERQRHSARIYDRRYS